MVKLKADNDSSAEAIVDQIPSSPTFVTNNPSQFTIAGNSLLTAANGKALGYTSSFSLDAQIDFNSAFSFDTDPTNGTTTGTKDMFSTAVHELFHAMGFDSAVDDEAGVLADGT